MQDQDRVKTKRSKTENWNWARTAGTEAQMALGKDSPRLPWAGASKGSTKLS